MDKIKRLSPAGLADFRQSRRVGAAPSVRFYPLVPLPPYSPELNPVERLWLYLRERHLSLRLLDDYDQVVDACCNGWNQLSPQRIQSLCSYPYIKQVNA